MQRPLVRFLAPSARSTSRVHCGPGLPHPIRSAFRVSHPLDGLLLDWLPDLVSCRSAHGVPCPSEPFPRPEQPRLSARPRLLAVGTLRSPDTPRLACVDSRDSGHAASPGSRVDPWFPVHGLKNLDLAKRLDFKALLPGASPLRRRLRLSSHRARCSPGLLAPLQGDPSRTRFAAPHKGTTASSRGLGAAGPSLPKYRVHLPCLPLGVYPGRDWPIFPKEDRQTLLRFAYLVVNLSTLKVTLPWLMISPRGRVASPRLRIPSSGSGLAPRKRSASRPERVRFSCR
jgi:hypothetical protein